MFCPSCGAELPEGGAFCVHCGAALDGSGQSVPVLTQDPSLPEGIFRDDKGAYHWVYHLNMMRNPVPLLMIMKIMAYICGGMAVIVFLMTLLNHNTLAESLKAFAIVAFGIGGGIIVLAYISWLILMALHGSSYTVEHLMTEDRVEHLQTHEEREKSEKIKTAVFILGMLSDDPGTVGLAMAGREEMTSCYTDVRKLVASPRHDLIKVNNVLQHNHVYAYPHQYEFVWSYLASHCPGAKHKR